MRDKAFREETIFIVEEKCLGCNKCVRNCPVFGANISYTINGRPKSGSIRSCVFNVGNASKFATIKPGITEMIRNGSSNDLEQGERIAVLVAPAARTNFPEYKRVIGYLKKAGVDLVYDVSFGADITVWAYLKVLAETGASSLIAQPCPVIVNYVEKHQPALLDYLAPVHSPMMCTAIYLRKYNGYQDRLAFLSPCIGKNDEINDANTQKYRPIQRHVQKLINYLTTKGINLQEYPEDEFDDPGCGLGFVFPRPGGLRENVQALAGDV